MGFWDFLKKHKKQTVESEKISQNEIHKWLPNKKTEIEKQEQGFLIVVRERVFQLVSELEEKISVLQGVNVEEKKAEEKIKLIVKENLKNYIDYVEKLISKLKELNNEKDIVEEINFAFSDFKKRSALTYEKATILIGKEMGDVRNSIKKFFKDTEGILKDNQNVIDESKIIKSVESEIKKFNEIKKIRLEIIKNIEEYDNKTNNLKEIIRIKEEEIENIKKSEKFLEESRKEQELETRKQELEKDIDMLSKMINFKALTNFYHSFEKEMSIVKEYKENFKQTFQKTKGEDIFFLLRESKLQNVDILNKIQEIEEKRKEINNIVIEETGFEDLEIAIKEIKSEIDALNSEKSIKEKKSERLEGNLKDVINSIKIEVAKMNVELD